MANKTGGWAFPRPIGWNGLAHHEEHEASEPQAGMELRDYFAAKALPITLERMLCEAQTSGYIGPYVDVAATNAYAMADAMLKAREK